MILDIRFVERDGKKILQRKVQVWGNDGFYMKPVGEAWEDVPLVTEEPGKE